MSLSACDRVLSPIAPAIYCGRMGDAEVGWIELWDLLEDIPDHPKGSTVSEGTLRKLGFAIPNRRLIDGSVSPSRKAVGCVICGGVHALADTDRCLVEANRNHRTPETDDTVLGVTSRRDGY